MIYLSILGSACALIGDLMVVIYHFLKGDLSSQFLLKVLVVLIVAGSIFFHYRLEGQLGEDG